MDRPTALTAITLAACLLSSSATAQTGVLDQDNTANNNVAWNMGFFNDHQQDVAVGLTGQLVGFKIRMASRATSVGLPLAIFLGPGPHAPMDVPVWTGTAFVTITNAWEEVYVDVSIAGLFFNAGDLFVIRCGDAQTVQSGVDLTGNSGWPNAYYTPVFYETGNLRRLDRLYFQTFVLACSGGSVGRYGTGCPGTQNIIPELSLQGCPVGGGQVAVALTRGLGGSAAALFFGLGQGSIPVGGTCHVLAVPLILSPITLPLSGSQPGDGAASFPGILPPFAGQSFTMQGFVLDPASPAGFSVTNGVSVTIG